MYIVQVHGCFLHLYNNWRIYECTSICESVDDPAGDYLPQTTYGQR